MRKIFILIMTSILVMGMQTSIYSADIDSEFQKNYDILKESTTGEEWETFFGFYEAGTGRRGEWYKEYIQGGNLEDYVELSAFDKFIYSETYLTYVNSIDLNREKYLGSEENHEKNLTGYNVRRMPEKSPTYEAAKDAYLAIAKMQYDYIQENEYPYNFMNKKTYLEEIGSSEKKEKKKEKEEKKAKEKKEKRKKKKKNEKI